MNREPMHLERAKELLALRLYDELSSAEARELDRFLAASPAARAFAEELEAGLGRWKATGEAEVEPKLPADWDARLRAATQERPGRRALLRAVGTFVAGLAAGLLLTWAGTTDPGDDAPRPTERGDLLAQAGPEFRPLAAPPPRATGGETISRRGPIGRR